MRKAFFLLTALLCLNYLQSQYSFSWLDINPMPFKVSNNAVVEAFDGDSTCVYSFAGIDSTKTFSGIHLKSLKYSLRNHNWQQLPDLPDTMGKIACAASVVKNKIYIIGGYHVLQNTNEISSGKVHIFNPLTNQFETDGSTIPVPVDDHVQVVWRDSLIIVLAGWSNSGNVANVQIYNPALDQWTTGTSLPNNTIYKAFGASGTIIGDSIFYHGGVKAGTEFVATSLLRKGVINAIDPTQISWFQEQNAPGSATYRSACASFKNHLFWIGGAGTAYNYNGIAYNGSGGVQPLNRILAYNDSTQYWFENPNQAYGVMDLRGIAKISPTSWIIAGGMQANQQVSDRVYLITLNGITENALPELSEEQEINIYPNPAENELYVSGIAETVCVEIRNAEGKLIVGEPVKNKQAIDLKGIASGFYTIRIGDQNPLKFIKN